MLVDVNKTKIIVTMINITINRKQTEQAKSFKYLGVTIKAMKNR